MAPVDPCHVFRQRDPQFNLTGQPYRQLARHFAEQGWKRLASETSMARAEKTRLDSELQHPKQLKEAENDRPTKAIAMYAATTLNRPTNGPMKVIGQLSLVSVVGRGNDEASRRVPKRKSQRC